MAEREVFFKTRNIDFFGRTVPIVLQNTNGPCPLIAICNVLLLRGDLNLILDVGEVSQKELLYMVEELLVYSYKDVDNISAVISLLPQLATGINVNIKFHSIDDFEFNLERAIFDLLGIPLYHGWIVDPQDSHTANAIGCMSYDSLTRELAITASLEVRSPSLLRVISCDDYSCTFDDDLKERKCDHGDKELSSVPRFLVDERPNFTNDVHEVKSNESPCLKRQEASSFSKAKEGIIDAQSYAGTLEKHDNEHVYKKDDVDVAVRSKNCLVDSSGPDPSSSCGENEPVYGKEECVVGSRMPTYDGSESMYEGKPNSAKQVENYTSSVRDTRPTDKITPHQVKLIHCFLKNSSSQLTSYGLSCLQDRLREREPCVLFRNNHLNTIFKFDSEVYLLVTDEGFIDQPDFVWEKLSEVNGNNMFVSDTFNELKVDSWATSSRDELNAISDIEELFGGIHFTGQANTSSNAGMQLPLYHEKEDHIVDRELAICLQKEEDELFGLDL